MISLMDGRILSSVEDVTTRSHLHVSIRRPCQQVSSVVNDGSLSTESPSNLHSLQGYCILCEGVIRRSSTRT